MTIDEALSAAIVRDPAENTPRLLYADRLEENDGMVACGCDGGSIDTGGFTPWGEPIDVACGVCDGTGTVSTGHRDRAEFIRVQIKLAEKGPHAPLDQQCDCSWCVLRWRERELLAAPHPFGDYRVYTNKLGWAEDIRHLVTDYTFSRGFVSHVTVPTLSVLLGGECRRCDGGRSAVRRAVPDHSSPLPGAYILYPATCLDCSGTGRTPGIAGELFSRHPVEAVTVADREPDENGGRYGWHLPWEGGADYPHDLLLNVFQRLDGMTTSPTDAYNLGLAIYSTRDLALTALSDAIVAVCRERAGLPPLSRPT